jgi:hypothetical protein
MPVVVDRHDREETGLEQLLALQGLRRGLECCTAPRGSQRSRETGVTDADLARELRGLITGLDRRVPRVERAGEASIARDAAALRAKALKPLAELAGDKDSAARPAADRSSLGARKE